MRGRYLRSTFAIAIVLLLLLRFWKLLAQEMPVPVEFQAPIFLKVLTYDRNYKERAASEVRIGIVYTATDKNSRKTKDRLVEVLRSLSDKTVSGLPLTYTGIKYQSGAQLEKAIKVKEINVLYITPGNTKNLKEIIKVSQTLRVITMTGVPEYVEAGLSIGIGLKGNKPEIIINLAAAKAVGSDFKAGLLHLARLIR